MSGAGELDSAMERPLFRSKRSHARPNRSSTHSPRTVSIVRRSTLFDWGNRKNPCSLAPANPDRSPPRADCRQFSYAISGAQQNRGTNDRMKVATEEAQL